MKASGMAGIRCLNEAITYLFMSFSFSYAHFRLQLHFPSFSRRISLHCDKMLFLHRSIYQSSVPYPGIFRNRLHDSSLSEYFSFLVPTFNPFFSPLFPGLCHLLNIYFLHMFIIQVFLPRFPLSGMYFLLSSI